MIYPKTFESKIGFDEIRSLLRERCLSPLGKEKVDELVAGTDAAEINERLAQVREFRRLQEEADDFPMQYFFDVRQAVSRLRLEGTHLDEGELFDLKRSLDTICGIVGYLNRGDGTDDDDGGAESSPYPALRRLTDGVATFPQLVEKTAPPPSLPPYAASLRAPRAAYRARFTAFCARRRAKALWIRTSPRPYAMAAW